MSPSLLGIRPLIKSLGERTLAPAAPFVRRTLARRGAAVILAYHNVMESRARARGDRSLHLSLDDFVQQMERLRRTHEVVSLRELMEAPAPAPTGRPRAAVTFDDAYRGALRLALPAMAERGLPATVFVPPGLLGGEGFWWDVLADPDGDLDPTVRQRALSTERGRPSIEGAVGPAVHPDAQPASLGELQAALRLRGMDAASHTWSHPNLTALDDPELRGELERPRQWLRDHVPDAALDHLSFPYGLWDERVARLAAAAGYRFLYRVDGGVAQPRESTSFPAVFPRVNIPAGVTPRGFDLRTAGIGAR